MNSRTIWGAVGGMKILSQHEEIANATSVTLSDIERVVAEIKGAGIMGSFNLPIPGQISPMTVSISVRAAGANKKALCAPHNELEIRFGTGCRESDGTLVPVGTKIFFKGYLTKVTGGKAEPGSPRDEVYDYSVIRYREIVDGEEITLIDQVANIMRIGGQDLMEPMRRILG